MLGTQQGRDVRCAKQMGKDFPTVKLSDLTTESGQARGSHVHVGRWGIFHPKGQRLEG